MGATRHPRTKRARIRTMKRKNPHVNTRKLASCEGKIRHNKSDRVEVLSRYPEGAVKFYKCEFCRWYHVGRARRKNVRRK